MEGSIVWWQSKAMWGALITMALGIVRLTYHPIDLTEAEIALLSGQIVDFINQMLGLFMTVTGFMSLWGRKVATKTISNNLIKKPE